MKALRKAVFFLAALSVLLGPPLTVAVENDDLQNPPAINLAVAPAAVCQSSRGTVYARALLSATVLVAAYPLSLHSFEGNVSSLVFHDCRSSLRSLCVLRC